jgi:hypothetical protein
MKTQKFRPKQNSHGFMRSLKIARKSLQTPDAEPTEVPTGAERAAIARLAEGGSAVEDEEDAAESDEQAALIVEKERGASVNGASLPTPDAEPTEVPTGAERAAIERLAEGGSAVGDEEDAADVADVADAADTTEAAADVATTADADGDALMTEVRRSSRARKQVRIGGFAY